VLESQTDLVDAQSGELYVRATGSAFFVGQGGWRGPKVSRKILVRDGPMC